MFNLSWGWNRLRIRLNNFYSTFKPCEKKNKLVFELPENMEISTYLFSFFLPWNIGSGCCCFSRWLENIRHAQVFATNLQSKLKIQAFQALAARVSSKNNVTLTHWWSSGSSSVEIDCKLVTTEGLEKVRCSTWAEAGIGWGFISITFTVPSNRVKKKRNRIWITRKCGN